MLVFDKKTYLLFEYPIHVIDFLYNLKMYVIEKGQHVCIFNSIKFLHLIYKQKFSI